MDALISVIVPVYKVEKYLDECVQSILAQTYKNMEIILVDDGSPDGCPAICDEWRERDPRIKVVHQENKGGGSARNTALELAKGEYIGFVDSDDIISPIMFEFLIGLIKEDIDIAECDYHAYYGEECKFDSLNLKPGITEFSCNEAMKENLKEHYFKQVIWNKVYRKSVIDDIRFPEGIGIDDEFWTYQVIGNARKLVHADIKLYAYRQQDESIMHLIDSKQRMQAVEARKNRHIYICQHMPDLINESLYSLWVSCIYQGQLLLRLLPDDENKEYVHKLRDILIQYPIKVKDAQAPFNQKVWLFLASISLINTCRLRNRLGIGL